VESSHSLNAFQALKPEHDVRFKPEDRDGEVFIGEDETGEWYLDSNLRQNEDGTLFIADGKVQAKTKIERSEPCNFPGCKKKFRRAEHMKRHIKSHSTKEEDKPFKCVICAGVPGVAKLYKGGRSDNFVDHLHTHCKNGMAPVLAKGKTNGKTSNKGRNIGVPCDYLAERILAWTEMDEKWLDRSIGMGWLVRVQAKLLRKHHDKSHIFFEVLRKADSPVKTVRKTNPSRSRLRMKAKL